MKTTANISKRALALFIITPLMGVYLLSSSCTVGDLLFDCCTTHQMERTTAKDHPSHAGTDHQNMPDDSDKSCCSDQAIGFLSVFQIHTQLPALSNSTSVDGSSYAPGFKPCSVLISSDLFSNIYNERPFILFRQSGRSLRILHQSFLN